MSRPNAFSFLFSQAFLQAFPFLGSAGASPDDKAERAAESFLSMMAGGGDWARAERMGERMSCRPALRVQAANTPKHNFDRMALHGTAWHFKIGMRVRIIYPVLGARRCPAPPFPLAPGDCPCYRR